LFRNILKRLSPNKNFSAGELEAVVKILDHFSWKRPVAMYVFICMRSVKANKRLHNLM